MRSEYFSGPYSWPTGPYCAHSRLPERMGPQVACLGDLRPPRGDERTGGSWINDERAGCALEAVEAYAVTRYAYRDGEAVETILRDLLGDLRHLAEALGLDHARIDADAAAVHAEERWDR